MNTVNYWWYLTHTCRDKGVYTFPKGISPKVKVIERFNVELAHNNVTDDYFSLFTTKIPTEVFEAQDTSRLNHNRYKEKISFFINH